MQDIDFIRNFPDEFAQAMNNRGIDLNITEILDLDKNHRNLIRTIQAMEQRANQIAREIPISKKNGLSCSTLVEESKNINVKKSELSQQLMEIRRDLDNILEILPNVPLPHIPVGKNDESNVEVRRVMEPRIFNFPIKSHFELGERLGLMDFKEASKISGSRFVFLYGKLAQLERALASFMLDMHTKEFGYLEVSSPYLVKEETMYGVGQLPKFSDDSFKTTCGLRLIPTSEVPLTAIVAGHILKQEDLPLRMTSYTQCFRSEAGSGGKDIRGMIRQHQFGKVELVSITSEIDSLSELERMTAIVEEVLKRLQLPYRVMLLCTGDMGFSSCMTYDLEVWIPSQNKYREISSCSNCGTFQARRMKARYSGDKGNNKFVHTLNGSALAVGRTLVAIMENYQEADGSISIPSVLRPYLGYDKIPNI